MSCSEEEQPRATSVRPQRVAPPQHREEEPDVKGEIPLEVNFFL